jgi:hypothetical protein
VPLSVAAGSTRTPTTARTFERHCQQLSVTEATRARTVGPPGAVPAEEPCGAAEVRRAGAGAGDASPGTAGTKLSRGRSLGLLLPKRMSGL